tara:strand:+ start:2771 stop:4843 length:2073 start_codon:yes stop_codon:yes gene_type:complete
MMMTTITTFLNPIFTMFLLCILGLILSYFSIKSFLSLKTEKNNTDQNTKLILDSIRQFAYRSISAIIQIIIYTSITLLILTKIFSKLFIWMQICSFFIGGLVIILILYVIIETTPKIIPITVEKSKSTLTPSLHFQFNTSAILSLFILSLLLLGLIICYYLFGQTAIIGYTLGILLASFFLRIGGGLYKTGADIGSNLSKTKVNISKELDAKNPGTLLDFTGDFIGKLIGFNADILGSFLISLIACIFFSEALLNSNIINTIIYKKLINLPFLIIIASFIGNIIAFIWCKRRINNRKIDNILFEGLYINIFFCAIATYIVINQLNLTINIQSIWIGNHTFLPFLAYLIGLIGAILISYTSEVLTSHRYSTSRHLASLAEYGNTITSIVSLSLGLRSNGFYLIYLCLITITAYFCAGFYGVALASLGMLSNTISIITINNFNSIASSTHQIAKLSKENETTQRNTQKLYEIGQTTLAIGSGFSTGTALISCTGIFFSITLISQVNLLKLFTITPTWLIGLILGVSIPIITCGFLLKSLRKVSIGIINEIQRQFNQIPFLKDGKAHPDMIKASQKSSIISMNGLVIPGILLTAVPIILGFTIGINTLVSYTLGTILVGLILGFAWGNIGEISKNAKYYIKKGHFGGQQTKAYENIQSTDRIGDVYKDLLSPSINIIMKSVIILTALIMLFLK